jgi:hypothetical protein
VVVSSVLPGKCGDGILIYTAAASFLIHHSYSSGPLNDMGYNVYS